MENTLSPLNQVLMKCLKTLQVIRLKESLKVLQKAKIWSISRTRKRKKLK